MSLRTLLSSATALGAFAFVPFALEASASAASLDPALRACVGAAVETSHASHLDVVRVVEHAGRGSYEYWIDADGASAQKAYCRTQRDAVTEFQSFDGRWGSAHAPRPQPAAQTVASSVAATSAASCNAGFTPPSNTGASARND
jgi:hypothetical protein